LQGASGAEILCKAWLLAVYDAGIRYGGRVPKDRIAMPLTGPVRWAIVGSPEYVARRRRRSAASRSPTAQLIDIVRAANKLSDRSCP
jgi:hypothetical protein